METSLTSPLKKGLTSERLLKYDPPAAFELTMARRPKSVEPERTASKSKPADCDSTRFCAEPRRSRIKEQPRRPDDGVAYERAQLVEAALPLSKPPRRSAMGDKTPELRSLSA